MYTALSPFVFFTSFHPNLLCCRMDISPISPLYTDFDGDTENIFVQLILTSTRSIHRSEKRESAILSSAHGFYPKKIEKRVSKSQTRLCEKKCAIVSYFRRKNKAEQLYKALDGGGVTIYQSKDCILKTLCDLQFLERSCRIKS